MSRPKAALCTLAALGTLALLAGSGWAAGLREQDARSHFALGNGLEVVVLEAPASSLVASLAVVRAGSRDEDAGQAGISHLLEHLLFDGGAARSKEELFREVYGLGAYLNGFTRKDLTGYIIMGAPDHLGRLLELQADLLFHPAFDPAKLPVTLDVVREELRSAAARPETAEEDRHAARAFERLAAAYGTPVRGTEVTLGGLSRDAIVAFHRRHYAPNNVLLLVMGPVTARQVEPLVAARFGMAAPQTLFAPRVALPPALPGPRLFTDTTAAPRKALALTVVLPIEEASYPALAHLPSLLESRLQRRREKAGLPSAVKFAASLEVHRDLMVFEVTARLPQEVDEHQVFALTKDEVERLAAGDVTAADFATAHRALRMEEASLRERIHYWLMARAGEALAFGPKILVDLPGRFAAVSLDDVRAAGRRALATPFTASLFAPEGPEAAAGPPKGVPPPVREILPNGTVALAQEAPGGSLLAVHVLVRDRARREPPGRTGIAEVLHRMLPRGTRRDDALAVQHRLEALGARLSVAPDPTVPFGDAYASKTSSSLRLEVLAGQARDAVALLTELLDEPRLDPRDLASVKAELQAILARQTQRASRVAEERLEDRLLVGTPYAHPIYGTPESLAGIKPEDVRDFHRVYFAPENLVVSAVGGLPGPELLDLVRDTFGRRAPASPPPLPPLAAPPAPGPEPPPGLPIGRGQVALAWGRLIPGSGARPDLALELAASLLSARLFERLREKEGLAYSVGASVERLGPMALVTVRMATAPEKLAAARAGIAREMEALGREAIATAEIERRANALAGRWAMRLLSSINRAYALGVAEFAGLPHRFGEDYRVLLRSVAPAEVEQAIRSTFRPDAGVWSEAR